MADSVKGFQVQQFRTGTGMKYIRVYPFSYKLMIYIMTRCYCMVLILGSIS